MDKHAEIVECRRLIRQFEAYIIEFANRIIALHKRIAELKRLPDGK